jgi:pilus assembly protein CpaF
MIAKSGFSLTVHKIIVGSGNVIVQAARLRNDSRPITHITEVISIESDVLSPHDLVLYIIKSDD